MLVLSRQEEQEIVIGEEDVVIKVLEIQAGKVRLGITAPKDVSVHRREVWIQIQQEEEGKANGQSN